MDLEGGDQGGEGSEDGKQATATNAFFFPGSPSP